MIKHDPIEDTPEYKAIEKQLEADIVAEIGDNMYRGRCYKYWNVKRRILKEKYGIDWESPAMLNRGVRFS